MKVVILAGGAGTRLWPLSRERHPKQLQSILGKETLLRSTYQRVLRVAPQKDILIATGAVFAAAVRRELPELPRENVLVEPVRRDSAGAIGLAAACIAARDPDESMLSVHADAWIPDERPFVSAVRAAGSALVRYPEHTVLFGVSPTYPETGYGYIQLNKKVVRLSGHSVYSVKRFIEKPARARFPNSLLFPLTTGFWRRSKSAWLFPRASRGLTSDTGAPFLRCPRKIGTVT